MASSGASPAETLQVLNSPNTALNGVLASSFRLIHAHGYLNWATKYFLDALLLQERLSRGFCTSSLRCNDPD